MSDPSHHSNVNGTLNDQTQININLRLNQYEKNIVEIKDLLNNFVINRDRKTHRSRSRHGEGSKKHLSIHHYSTPHSNDDCSSHHNTDYYQNPPRYHKHRS